MGKNWRLMMGIAWHIKKGFTMLEMLICMVIVSSLLLISIRSNNTLYLDHLYFIDDYLLKQSEAIKSKEKVEISEGLYFNSMGHVNKAKTIHFKNHNVIVHLGNGYVSYE